MRIGGPNCVLNDTPLRDAPQSAAFDPSSFGPGPFCPMRRQSRGTQIKGSAMRTERFDIHQHITGQIMAAIERGAGEFRLPW